MTKQCLHWNDLDTKTLYDIMVLRQEVFVVEQNCPYLDADGKDILSYHVCFYDKEQLIAYTRLVPKGVSYPSYCSIGRVVNHKKTRGKGIGKVLMEYSIEQCQSFFQDIPIKISAQVYLLDFYTNLGFAETGDRYLEDNIPHCAMIMK